MQYTQNTQNKYERFYKNIDKISKFVYRGDLNIGEYYRSSFITLIDQRVTKLGNFDYHFKVRDLYSWREEKYYHTAVRMSNINEIVQVSCSCDKFKKCDTCEHLGGVFYNYSDVIFKKNIDLNAFSVNLLQKYSVKEEPQIKKEVFLELSINSHFKQYKENTFDVKVKIGESKLYSYGAHQASFINAYQDKFTDCKFGKDFIYNGKRNYFSDSNEVIIDYLNNNFTNINNSLYSGNDIVKLIKKLFANNVEFYFNDYKVNKLINDFPFNSYISKLDDNNYNLKIDIGNFVLITNDYRYIFYNGDIYNLSIKNSLLLKDLMENDINELILPKDKLELFSSSILPIIKNNTVVSDDIKDEVVIINDPVCKLYFDLKKKVTCAIKFVYNEEIDYFDESSNVLRNNEYESNVINELVNMGFVINNKSIYLDDIDKIVEFKENYINVLNEKYKVYTTEKLDNLKVTKSLIKTRFSIGQNNILNYDFDLGNINKDEIVNILKDLREKKKYYRLKNGDILSLEDNKLEQLESLKEELDISDEDVVNGQGTILKYRAIYLDSIKKDKYNIIETDNLFNNFIDNFYKYKDSQISLDDDDLKLLRDYQVTGVKWLYNLDKTGFGGILADEMGLGKTLQTIYYIKEILKEDKSLKFLIVVPTSLVYNWEHEFKIYSKGISTSLVVGLKDKRNKLLEKDVNVYITTYGLLREDEELYSDKEFHAVIIDEAQNIKNPLALSTRAVKKINSKVKFALTGTPIENSTIELWSIFDFIMPGYLTTAKKFSNKYRINDFNDKTNKLIEGLSKQITPFILRRLKKDVIKELPQKLENNIYIELSDEQKKIYVSELDRVKKEVDRILKDEGTNKMKFLLLPLLTKLRQICIDPKIVYEEYEGTSNKMERLLSIVDESIKNGHKILIFTSFRSALEIARRELKNIGINAYVIDGSVSSKDRIDRVNSFNNDKNSPKVFLIMLKAGGTGLNLASADIVIHLDLWWNPQAENQATDRAHRIGQTNVVNVIRLVSKGTIEEKVLELQQKKKELSDKLLDSSSKDKNILSSLTEKDIMNLLSYENKS